MPIMISSSPPRHARDGRDGEEEEDGDVPGVIVEDVPDTIDSVDPRWLRYYMKTYCKQNNEFADWIAKNMMNPGKDIVRYHVDTDDEDAEETDEDEDHQEDAIPIENFKLASKIQRCTHCEESFDLTTNDRGACTWHPGQSLSCGYSGWCLTRT